MLIGALRLKKRPNAMNKVILYCRQGFEKECAAEITDKAAKMRHLWFCPCKRKQRVCVVSNAISQMMPISLANELPFSELIFARQLIVVGELLKDLPTGRSHFADRWAC